MRFINKWLAELIALSVICGCIGLFYLKHLSIIHAYDDQVPAGCVGAFEDRRISGEYARMVFLDQIVCPNASDASLVNVHATFSTTGYVKFLETDSLERLPAPITLVSSTFTSTTHVTREQPYSFDMVLRVPPNTPYKYVSFGLTAYYGVGKSEPDGPMYGAGSSFYVCRTQEKVELVVLKPEEELRDLGVCSPEITQR